MRFGEVVTPRSPPPQTGDKFGVWVCPAPSPPGSHFFSFLFFWGGLSLEEVTGGIFQNSNSHTWRHNPVKF